ncbi:hypothetical protein N037_04460 [Enterobacter sp. EGD-HP1]|nr:hypothetical protein N037_04460 [Enterobacter sp. EGD-HP1]
MTIFIPPAKKPQINQSVKNPHFFAFFLSYQSQLSCGLRVLK